MDVVQIAKQIVAIRVQMAEATDDEERERLHAELRSLQERLVDPEPDRVERDEVDVSHPVPPV